MSWSKFLVIAGPFLFWGALGAYANVERSSAEQPPGDAALFGGLVALGILALGYSVRAVFDNGPAQAAILLAALAMSWAVIFLNWNNTSFFVIGTALTVVLAFAVIRRVQAGALERNS